MPSQLGLNRVVVARARRRVSFDDFATRSLTARGRRALFRVQRAHALGDAQRALAALSSATDPLMRFWNGLSDSARSRLDGRAVRAIRLRHNRLLHCVRFDASYDILWADIDAHCAHAFGVYAHLKQATS